MMSVLLVPLSYQCQTFSMARRHSFQIMKMALITATSLFHPSPLQIYPTTQIKELKTGRKIWWTLLRADFSNAFQKEQWRECSDSHSSLVWGSILQNHQRSIWILVWRRFAQASQDEIRIQWLASYDYTGLLGNWAPELRKVYRWLLDTESRYFLRMKKALFSLHLLKKHLSLRCHFKDWWFSRPNSICEHSRGGHELNEMPYFGG